MNLSVEIIDKRNDTIKKVSGVIIQEDGEIDFCYKKEVDCDHEFRAISNNWHNWNTGILMTRGRCVKYGIEKEIKFSMVRKN